MAKLTDENTCHKNSADVHQLAENKTKKSKDQSLSDLKTMSPAEIHKLVNELQTHKTEIEMQNDELRRAQLDLNSIKEHFYDLYNLAPVGYCSINEKGLIIEANLTASTLLGVAQRSLIGQPISFFILEEDQEIYYFHQKRLFQTRVPQASELRMVNNDKTIFWARLEETLSFHDSSSEPVSRLILTDVTEFKQVQEEYKLFFDLIPDMVCIASLDGYFIKMNDSWQVVLGYSKDEMLAVSFIDLIHPDDKEATLAEINRLIHGKVITHFTNRYRHKNGNYRWFEWNSTPNEGGLIFAVARDITERKQIEATLLESEQTARALLNNPVDGALLLDLEGRIIDLNETTTQRSGKSKAELTGEYIWDFFPKELMKKWKKYFLQVVRLGEPVRFESEWDGLWLDTIFSPILRENGKVDKISGLARDITHIKFIENKLEKSQKALEDLVKIRTAVIKQKTASLGESNIALKVLLEQRMTDKENLEKEMLFNIKNLLIPYLERADELSSNLQQKTYLELIKTNLNDIISPFAPKLGNLLSKLSPAELEVVDLIKHGKSNKEIAALLNLSPSTITTYRQRIRKKLNLTNSKINLNSILNSN